MISNQISPENISYSIVGKLLDSKDIMEDFDQEICRLCYSWWL